MYILQPATLSWTFSHRLMTRLNVPWRSGGLIYPSFSKTNSYPFSMRDSNVNACIQCILYSSSNSSECVEIITSELKGISGRRGLKSGLISVRELVWEGTIKWAEVYKDSTMQPLTEWTCTCTYNDLQVLQSLKVHYPISFPHSHLFVHRWQGLPCSAPRQLDR